MREKTGPAPNAVKNAEIVVGLNGDKPGMRCPEPGFRVAPVHTRARRARTEQMSEQGAG